MMITKIQAKDIKGSSFEQNLGRLNLFLGPNGVGKSARCDALTLAILGYVPGVAKKNSEILDTFGSAGKLFVGFETDDKTHFLRRFSRDESGSVAQDYMLDRRKATRDKYMQALAGIKILDLAAFMELSDRAKVDHIFALFPPAGDLGDFDQKIEALKEELSSKQNSLKTLTGTEKMRGTISRLVSARAEIQLPSGTLAETTEWIKTTETVLSGARQSRQNALTFQAQIEAGKKAKLEASANLERERAQIEAEAKVKAESEVFAQHQAELQAVREAVVSDPVPSELFGVTEEIITGTPRTKKFMQFSSTEEAELSIKSIIATMQRTGCTTCAAMLVCKRELKKFKGAAA